MRRIAEVVRVLDGLGAPYALIGAHAMAARGYPRFTVDVDFLTTDSQVLNPSEWAGLVRAGAAVEVRRGDDDDPLAGVVHIALPDGAEVDVIVGRWKWEADVIARADAMQVGTMNVLVPRLADLVLLKVAAGGHLDLRDAVVLLTLGDRDALVQEVESRLADVRPQVDEAWLAVKAGL